MHQFSDPVLCLLGIRHPGAQKEPQSGLNPTQHPLQHGQILYSPGGHFCYRVVGPCCRLFDREELPWPCCRLQWRGKEPSWRRIGRRFTPDIATLKSPSYCVEVVGQEQSRPFVITLYSVKLSHTVREWWHSKKPQTEDVTPPEVTPPEPISPDRPSPTPAFSLDSTGHRGQPAS
jgi:hypothetical protein